MPHSDEFNTLMGKRFYNIDNKKKITQDLTDSNAEFCFGVYSTLN